MIRIFCILSVALYLMVINIHTLFAQKVSILNAATGKDDNSRERENEESGVCTSNAPDLTLYSQVGSGTPSSPYEIYNEKQFRSIATTGAGQWGYSYLQCASITFTYNSTNPQFFIPIFVGYYDGNGYFLDNFIHDDAPGLTGTIRGSFSRITLKNFRVKKSVYSVGNIVHMGLLGGESYGPLNLEEITIQDSTLSADGNSGFRVGGLIGYMSAGGLINKVYIKNSNPQIKLLSFKEANCGGLIGFASFVAVDMKNIRVGEKGSRVTIECGGLYVGGFGASIKGSTMQNIELFADIIGGEATTHMGGLVASLDTSNISYASVDGTLFDSKSISPNNAPQISLGGLVGTSSNSKINYTRSSAKLKFTQRNSNDCSTSSAIGGLIGRMYNGELNWSRAELGSTISVSNFFGAMGGLVGSVGNKFFISNSYARLKFELESAPNTIDLGGAIGRVSSVVFSGSALIANIYSDFSYSIIGSTPVRFIGGSVGLLFPAVNPLSSTLFSHSIASLNNGNGGYLPAAGNVIFNRNEGKFLGASWNPGFQFIPSDESMNFLGTMICHQNTDELCNTGISYPNKTKLFNIVLGPLQYWSWGPNQWLQSGGAGQFPIIPKATSVFPNFL